MLGRRMMMAAAGTSAGCDTTSSSSGEWAGGTAKFTFPGDDVEVATNDNFIYTNDEFTGDFEFTFTHKTNETRISAIGIFESSNKGSVNINDFGQSFSGWYWQAHPPADYLTDYETIAPGSTVDFSMSGVSDGDIVTFKRVGDTLTVEVNSATVHTFATTSSATLSAFVGSGAGNTGHILNVSWCA